MDPARFQPLARLAVHGANVQPGQTVLVNAELGHEPLARAIAAEAYDRGARFVDVWYFDPHVKRARIKSADPETLAFVPSWYGRRMVAHADERGARDQHDRPDRPEPARRARPGARRARPAAVPQRDPADRRRPDDELVRRSLPDPAWAKLVYPELADDEALETLWRELEHVLRLDEPDPVQAWEERMAALRSRPTGSPRAASTRSTCRGPAPT